MIFDILLTKPYADYFLSIKYVKNNFLLNIYYKIISWYFINTALCWLFLVDKIQKIISCQLNICYKIMS